MENLPVSEMLPHIGSYLKIQQDTEQTYSIRHHSFDTGYESGKRIVLDFCRDSGIIRVRGECYAETWFYP